MAMNRILVIGAAGMIGRKLLQKLAQDGSLGGSQIAHATLHDLVAPQPPPKAAFQVRSAASDLDRPQAPAEAGAGRFSGRKSDRARDPARPRRAAASTQGSVSGALGGIGS